VNRISFYLNNPISTTTGKNHGTSPRISRYDPTAMNRITDITDLVLDDSNSDDEDSIIDNGFNSSMEIAQDVENGRVVRKGRRRRGGGQDDDDYGGGVLGLSKCRQLLVIIAIVSVICGASLAILYAVGRIDDPQTIQGSYLVSTTDNVEEESSTQQQKLLEMAERVITACDEDKLNDDMSACQHLCHGSMCCFETDEYGCQDDASKDCAVYAGCEALVTGIPLGGTSADEE